jgi:hypothetical protein
MQAIPFCFQEAGCQDRGLKGPGPKPRLHFFGYWAPKTLEIRGVGKVTVPETFAAVRRCTSWYRGQALEYLYVSHPTNALHFWVSENICGGTVALVVHHGPFLLSLEFGSVAAAGSATCWKGRVLASLVRVVNR